MDTKQKKIPKKITPDFLRDAIVTVNFTTDYNSMKIESNVRNSLIKYFKKDFIKYPIGKNDPLKININNKPYFYSDGIIKVQIEDNHILFNCVNEYIGWSKYIEYIYCAIHSISDIVHFKSSIVNYISILPDVSIFNILDGSIILNCLDIFDGSEFNFNCSAGKDGVNPTSKVTARLTNNLMINNQKISIVNIMVSDLKEISDDSFVEKIIESLTNNHFFQKDIFFRLLKDDFLNTLKPEW